MSLGCLFASFGLVVVGRLADKGHHLSMRSQMAARARLEFLGSAEVAEFELLDFVVCEKKRAFADTKTALIRRLEDKFLAL